MGEQGEGEETGTKTKHIKGDNQDQNSQNKIQTGRKIHQRQQSTMITSRNVEQFEEIKVAKIKVENQSGKTNKHKLDK